MHTASHIMSGWCAASLLPGLTARQRLAAMVAASIADLDALSYLGGESAYQTYHHRLTHSLPFGLVACAVLAIFTGRRFAIFAFYLVLFHLHLMMDMFGSGPGWPIFYLWPLSDYFIDNRNISWEFYSWQNLTIAGGLLVWTVVIAVRQGRTPLELIAPRIDRKAVAWLRRFGRGGVEEPGKQ